MGVHGIHDVLSEIAWVGGGVAHPADARHLGHTRQKGREIPSRVRGIAVTVHVLSQQLDLAVALAGQAARFRHHAVAGAAALRSARERHHAIRARFVAALDDGDIGAMGIVAAGERGIEGLIRYQAQAGDPAFAGFEPPQHLA